MRLGWSYGSAAEALMFILFVRFSKATVLVLICLFSLSPPYLYIYSSLCGTMIVESADTCILYTRDLSQSSCLSCLHTM